MTGSLTHLRRADGELSLYVDHLVTHPDTIASPEELHGLLVALTVLTSKLPMLLDRARSWVETEWDGHRLVHANGNELSATVAVGGLVVDLDAAGEDAHSLGRHFEHAADYAATLRRP